MTTKGTRSMRSNIRHYRNLRAALATVLVYRGGVPRTIPVRDVRPTDVCPRCWDGEADTIGSSKPHTWRHAAPGFENLENRPNA